jgi:hypothetical protein
MASSQSTSLEANCAAAVVALAKALAPEEVRPGDYVTPLHMIAEVPSYWWFGEAWSMPPEDPVRMRYTTLCDGAPLRVISVCLPFVLLKQPCGSSRTLDLRRCQLARLDVRYAKRAWKALKKSRPREPTPVI